MRNLADLQKETEKLGLTVVQTGKKMGKADYVAALRQYYLDQDFVGGKLPYQETEPMKCFAIWNLSEDEQEKIWESPSWAAQEKLNGCRMVMCFVEGVGVFAHSRTVSEKTYRYTELTAALLFKDFVPDFDAIVDMEAYVEKAIDTRPYTGGDGCVTKSSLHSTSAIFHLKPESARALQVEQEAPLIFKVFDIISWEGIDQKDYPLKKRLKALTEFRDVVLGTELGKYFEFPPVITCARKKEWCEEIWAKGGEGVILKNLDSLYVASSSRPRDGWVKVKKGIEFDVFVTGANRGEEGKAWRNLVGDLEFSVLLDNGKEHMIGRCSNLTMEFRQAISIYDADTDTVSLRPDMFGKVAQISGQDVSPRSLRLSHCTLDRWRDQAGDQKTKDQCVVSWADLRKASEWVG